MRTYLGLLTNAARSALRSKHDLMLYRSWFLGHCARGNHAAAPVLGESAWRTAARVRWPWRSTSHFWL